MAPCREGRKANYFVCSLTVVQLPVLGKLALQEASKPQAVLYILLCQQVRASKEEGYGLELESDGEWNRQKIRYVLS